MSTAAPPQVADYSYIAALAECPRRSYYAHELGLIPRETAISLHAGRVGHAALHELYASGWDVESAVEVVHEEWGSVVPHAAKSYLTAGHLELIIRNYADDRHADIIKPLTVHRSELDLSRVESFAPSVDDEGNVVFAETPLAVKLTDSLIYGGLIDLPARIGSDIYIVDHKFTGQWITERWASKYARSMQIRGYVAMMQLVLGKPVAGAYINGIHMGKNASDPKSKWTSRTSSRSALFGPYTFSEGELAEVSEWASEWLVRAEHMRMRAMALAALIEDPASAWPKNDRACDHCDYARVCAHENPSVREGILRTFYTPRSRSGILASGADSDD